jgi:hypothetical protein
VGCTFFIITHNIESVKRTADFIGMLYRSSLVRFGPAHEMFNSSRALVKQFLAGSSEGPISMDEMVDAAKGDEEIQALIAGTGADGPPPETAREQATAARAPTAADGDEDDQDTASGPGSPAPRAPRVSPPPPPPAAPLAAATGTAVVSRAPYDIEADDEAPEKTAELPVAEAESADQAASKKSAPRARPAASRGKRPAPARTAKPGSTPSAASTRAPRARPAEPAPAEVEDVADLDDKERRQLAEEDARYRAANSGDG